MMNGEKRPLYDAEIEYLASEQDAWINTGLNGNNNNLSLDCEIMVEPTSYSCYPFGNFQTASRKMWGMVATSDTKATIRINASASIITNNQFDFSVGVKHHIVANRTTTTIDGASYTNGTANASTNQYPTIALFKGNTRTAMNAGKVTIYYFKIYNGETLERDFIPVRKGSVGYMYDRVSGELFGNAGTGNFILGADILWGGKYLNINYLRLFSAERRAA